MKKSYASEVVFLSTPEQISQLLHLDEKKPEPWREEELRDMVRHQMSASLEFDLSSVHVNEPESKIISKSFIFAAQSEMRTFDDLFRNPNPPVELLRLSQRFFKQKVKESPKDSAEHKCSYLFYLLSIVVARIRCNINICRLTDEEQLHAINSMMKRFWVVDDRIRELLGDCQKRISKL